MKKLFILFCFLFSLISFAEDFDGVWRAELEDRIIYIKIEGNNIFYIQRNLKPHFKDFKSKGILFKKDEKFYMKRTHVFSLFEWRELQNTSEIYSIEIKNETLILNNGKLLKSDINTIFKDELKYRLSS